jgi:LAS superfamily LD-carboxypeptidase LdcB
MTNFNKCLVIMCNCVALLMLPVAATRADTDKQLYGPTPVEHYLTGNYRANTHPGFVALHGIDQHDPSRKLWLRKEAATALVQMQMAFNKDYPDIPFTLVSTTRSFNHQRAIWERKWNRYKKIKSEQRRLYKILGFSALPGVSRHHWGTEFDLSPLINDYYKSGKGKVLYDWLSTNAVSYGFCQPYTAGRNSGHKEERWHWSYKPLATIFYRQWLQAFSGNKPASITSDYIKRYPDTAVLYMKSIAEQCQ